MVANVIEVSEQFIEKRFLKAELASFCLYYLTTDRYSIYYINYCIIMLLENRNNFKLLRYVAITKIHSNKCCKINKTNRLGRKKNGAIFSFKESSRTIKNTFILQ